MSPIGHRPQQHPRPAPRQQRQDPGLEGHLRGPPRPHHGLDARRLGPLQKRHEDRRRRRRRLRRRAQQTEDPYVPSSPDQEEKSVRIGIDKAGTARKKSTSKTAAAVASEDADAEDAPETPAKKRGGGAKKRASGADGEGTFLPHTLLTLFLGYEA